MDTALVQDAQHDVHGHDRGEHEQQRAREGVAERTLSKDIFLKT